jgi:tripartite-type tricarboxylate transporter receptor subunit TctC
MAYKQGRTFSPLRRLIGAAVCAVLAGAGTQVQAQAWPAKQVRIVVATPPGNAPDIAARAIADKLGALWGQQVLVDNRPGAAGIVAVDAVRQAPADGYTLFLAHASVMVVTPHTYKSAHFDTERDFVPVSIVGVTPMMLGANMAAPFKTLAETIAYAKANPDKVSIGNPTRTSIPHLAAELIGQSTNTRFFNVPFSGSAPMITAAVNGDTMMAIDGVAVLLPMVKAGKLRPIAVTSERLLPGLEGYPLARDTLPGFEVLGWFGLFALKGTPPAVLAKINEDANKALAQPDVIKSFATFGTYPRPGSLEEAVAYVKKEQTVWTKVLHDAGIKAE